MNPAKTNSLNALHIGAVGVLLVIAMQAGVRESYAQQTSNAEPARWPDEKQVGPFKIHANFALTQIQGLPEELSQLQEDIAALLQVTEFQEPIYIFLFQHKSTYQNYLKRYFPEVPSRKAIFVKQRGPGMVFAYLSDDFLVDLRHESTHALLHANLAVVPLWLDEGLAEYYELERTTRADGNPYMNSLQWKRRLGRLRKIETLEAISDVRKMGRSEYEESWGWVHYMLHSSEETRLELIAYLTDIRNMNPPGTLSRRLRIRVSNLDKSHKEHLKSWPSRQAALLDSTTNR